MAGPAAGERIRGLGARPGARLDGTAHPPPWLGWDLINWEGTVALRYTAAPAAFVIRPDGYIGFRSDRRTASAHLPRYLAKILAAEP
jgi:hypothetical protein